MTIQVNRRTIGIAVLALLAIHIVAVFPWRLAALFLETLAVDSTQIQRARNGNDKYWDAQDLEQRLERMGWTVSIQPLDGDAVGMTVFESRSMRIEQRQSWNEIYSTLAHEGAHTLEPWALHNRHAQEEIFAESVAALVAKDGVREHARYLARYKADILTMVAFWREIYFAAEQLQRS